MVGVVALAALFEGVACVMGAVALPTLPGGVVCLIVVMVSDAVLNSVWLVEFVMIISDVVAVVVVDVP